MTALKFDLTTTDGRAGALLDMARRRAKVVAEPEYRARTWTLPVPDMRQALDVPFAVTGGVATRIYMPERITDDLDLLILDGEDTAVHRAMQGLKAEYKGPHPAGGSRWLLPEGFPSDLPAPGGSWMELQGIATDALRYMAGVRRVDLIAIDAPWVRTALHQSAASPTGLPVLPLPYLMLMKLTTATLSDIADMSRMVVAADPIELRRIIAAVRRFAPDRHALLIDLLETVGSRVRKHGAAEQGIISR
jgi:hypothetical protein